MALDAVARSTENRGNIDLKSQHLADMMRICRASFPDMLRPKQEAAVGNIDEDLGFIPELLLAVLMSQYTSMLELNHTLHFDWVRTWEGWREAEQEIPLCNDDADLNEVTNTYVQRFTRLVWNNYEVKAQTDVARKTELIQSGRRIGIGRVHGNNLWAKCMFVRFDRHIRTWLPCVLALLRGDASLSKHFGSWRPLYMRRLTPL